MNKTKALNPNKQHFLHHYHMRGCVLIPIIPLLLIMYPDTVLRIAKASDKVIFKSSVVSSYLPLVKYLVLLYLFLNLLPVQ